jgi:very-short-patch-repair endonuclease
MAKRKAQDELVLSPMQVLLGIHCKELKLYPIYEHQFCERMWRFDMAFPEWRVAIEISGGNYSGGHRRGKDQEDEYAKLNYAQRIGWRVLQFTNAMVGDGRAKQELRELFDL